MAINVSLTDLVKRKALFADTPIASHIILVDAAFRNLCQAIGFHYGVGYHALEYSQNHAIWVRFDFEIIPEALQAHVAENRVNLVTFILLHDMIKSPQVTVSAQAVMDQAHSLGEAIASHFEVLFDGIHIEDALDFKLNATHEGHCCPSLLQAFDPDGELALMRTTGQGDN